MQLVLRACVLAIFLCRNLITVA